MTRARFFFEFFIRDFIFSNIICINVYFSYRNLVRISISYLVTHYKFTGGHFHVNPISIIYILR